MPKPYQTLKKSALWVDLGEEEVFVVEGKDPVGFLNNYNSQDIAGLPENQSALGAFLTQKGKLVSDSLILKSPLGLLVIMEGGYGQKVQDHLDTYLGFADVHFRDLTQEWGHLAVLGPKSTEILQRDLIPENADPLPSATLHILPLKFGPQSLLIFSTTRFGVEGWEILGPKGPFPGLIRKLQDLNLGQLDPETLEQIRVEAGLPKMGKDMDENNLVAEVGLDKRATSFNKGCYLGQETTARIQSRGHVNKKLYQLLIEKPLEGPGPFEIFQKEKPVGRITSLVYSPKNQAQLALGFLQTQALESPLSLEVKGPENSETTTLRVLSQKENASA